MVVTVRKIKLSDSESLTRHWNDIVAEDGPMNPRKPITDETTKEKIEKSIKLMEKGNYVYLIAETPQKLVGKITISRNKGRMQHVGVLSISVSKEARGLGVGKRLMKEALSEAKKLKWKIVKLAVMANNEPALKLYENYGFKQFGYLPKGMKRKGRYYDLIEMYKEL